MPGLGGVAVRVSEVVERDAVAVLATADVRAAAALLVEHHRSAAPVVDEQLRVVGSVCDADLLRAAPALIGAPGLPVGTPWDVAAVMAAPVLVGLDDDLDLALSLLRLRDVRCLSVTDHGRLVGVVTREQLLAVLSGHDPLLRRDVLDALADLAGPPPHACWDVQVASGVVHLVQRPGAPVTLADQELAAVLARTVPGVVDVVVPPSTGEARHRPGRSSDG